MHMMDSAFADGLAEVVLGLIGVIMLVTLLRLTCRLNPRNAPPDPGITPWTPAGRALLLAMLAPVVSMLISAWLVDFPQEKERFTAC